MKRFYPQACAVLRVVFENFGDKLNPLANQVYTAQVQAKRVQININAYTEADTFELELDYKVFPFDPRTIRSCQVSIHMQNMEKLKEGAEDVRIEPDEDNAVFQGFADEDKIAFNDASRTVTLKGRDFTALFTDAKWPGKLLPTRKTADMVIREIVDGLKAAGDIEVDNRTGEFVLPVLASFAPDFGQLSGQRNAKRRETYWDVIQDIANRAGIIAYMELDQLVLSKPRTLYNPDSAVTFIYGNNVKDLEFTRKLGRQKGFNVVVRSVVDKEVLKAEIPKDSTRLDIGGEHVKIPKQTAKGVVSEEEAPFISFAVSGIKNKNHLIEVGEAIFEELGRQQIEGRFKTHDMETAGEDDCFDVLKLRNGTPINLVIQTDDLAAITKESSVPERIRYLKERCYDAEIATIFAQTLGKFSTPFYTKAVSFSLDAENGFAADIDFLNFIETAGKGLGI